MHKLLLTRPNRHLKASQDAWSDVGYDIIPCPMTEIVPQPFDLKQACFTSDSGGRSDPIDPPSANISPTRWHHDTIYIITSQAAVEAGLRILIENNVIDHDQRVVTVGEITAEVAKSAGFKQVKCVADRVQELREWAQIELSQATNLIHLTAPDQAYDLIGTLLGAGFNAHQVICYQAAASATLTKSAIHALKNGEISIVPFYSGRALTIFERLIEESRMTDTIKAVELLAMSDRIAEQARLSWKTIKIASAPSETALIELVK